jgi:hypothetical protein
MARQPIGSPHDLEDYLSELVKFRPTMFAIALRVSDELREYAKEIEPDTRQMKIMKIFEYWRSTTENPTWELLCEKLGMFADYNTVIQKMREDHQIPNEAIGSPHDLKDYLSELVKFRPTMFAIALRVSDELREYAKEIEPDTRQMKIMKIFEYWRSTTENPTWELLCEKLGMFADYNTVIQKMREDHQIPNEAIGSPHDLKDYLSELVKFRPTMFAIALRVSDELREYAKEIEPDTRQMKIMKIFEYWRSTTENPTWELLCEKLGMFADYNTVIQKMREDHQIPNEVEEAERKFYLQMRKT